MSDVSLPTFDRIRSEAAALSPDDAVEVLLHYLRELLPDEALGIGVWPDYVLGPTMRPLLAALYAQEGRIVSYDGLIAAIYASREEVDDAMATIKALLSRHRPDLALRGIRIETVRGVGLRMDRDPGVVFPWESAA